MDPVSLVVLMFGIAFAGILGFLLLYVGIQFATITLFAVGRMIRNQLVTSKLQERRRWDT